MSKDTVIGTLMEKGWTREQAVGVAANIEQESTFRPDAVGDGGRAYGIAQWHPDRQANFRKAFGKDIKGSSVAEQAAFIDWELNNTEGAAGRRLRAARTAGEAGSIVSEFYERPAARELEKTNRSRRAAAMAGEKEGEFIPAVAPPTLMARQGPQSGAGDAQTWPRVPTYQRPDPYAPSPVKSVEADVLAPAQAAFVAQQGTAEAGRAGTAALEAQQVEHQKQVDATGWWAALQTSRQDRRDQGMFTVLDQINQANPNESKEHPGFYNLNRSDIERGITDDESVAFLRENVTGPNSLSWAKSQLALREENDKTYAMAGEWATFLGRGAGSMMDPVGFAAGLGAGKLLHLAGLGSRVLIAAGRPAAAAGSLAAEGALGNMAFEGVQDAMGEVKTTADYAMAGAFGAALAVPFTRGAFREASHVQVMKQLDEFMDKGVAEQAGKIIETRERTGITDPAELARRVETEEHADMRTDISETTTPNPIRDQAVPTDVQTQQRAEYDAPEVAPPAEKVEPPVVPEKPSEEAGAEAKAKHAEAEAKAEEVKKRQEQIDKAVDADAANKPETRQDPIAPLLPDELKRATPGYANGDRRFKLQFESDFDKALYIVSGKGKSKAHDKYMAFLTQHGFDEGQLAKFGKDFRDAIKAATDGQESGTLPVKDSGLSKRFAPELGGKEALEFPVLDGTASEPRAVPGKDGKPIWLGWDTKGKNGTEAQRQPNSFPVHEVLDAILAHDSGMRPMPKALAKYLRKMVSEQVSDVRVHFSDKYATGMYYAGSQRIESPGKLGVKDGSSIQEHLDGVSAWHQETVLHEIIHAMTHSKIEAWRNGRGASMTPELRAAMGDFTDLWARYRRAVETIYPIKRAAGWQPDPNSRAEVIESKIKYGLVNLHEFATQSMSDSTVQAFMARLPGKELGGIGTSIWREFTNVLAKILGLGDTKGRIVADNMQVEASSIVDRILRADGSNIVYSDGAPALMSTPNTNAAQNAYTARLYAHAQRWVANNPLDTRKLAVLTNAVKKYGGLSDGLVLAQSQNPILQMIAGLVSETTTGAAGRNANVAIRTVMMHKKFMGDGKIAYDNAYAVWGKQNGSTFWDNAVHGEKRREFDQQVYEELLDRRDRNYQPVRDGSVIEAANEMEALFERARVAQVQAGTLGSGNLPGNSKGYVPQAFNAAKFQTLDVAEMAAFHAELSAQLQGRLGWDAQFADVFAPYYTDRMRRRAQGSKEVDGLSAGGDSMQVVRDTLDDMAIDPQMRDRLTAAQKARAGVGSTKKRLDFDLRREFVPGKKLLEVYSTDTLGLARQYARRTAGHVSLAEQGILGIKGVRELREAAARPMEDGTRVTNQELESYDRIMAEVLGTPVAGQVVSNGASTMGLIVGLQRLGGLVFTQAMEQWNMLHHLGLRATLGSIGSIPQMLGEVGRLKKGQASGNSILTSIEVYGGEIGTESYKMIAPLDPPEGRLEDYMKQANIITRLARAGGHLQTKVSFFRGLMSAQHRAAAEQIVMRAARFVRDGGDHVALRDMGFTDDVVNSLRGDLANVAQWDARGNLIAFDLTRVSDPRTAEAFVQAVHRGTSQIIQGTFIGERSKWMHNDYMRLMLQLRTFGLTATEKQLQRTAMIHSDGQFGAVGGYGYAAGVLVAQVAMAMPLHAARVELASAGRSDREKYIKDNLNPVALARAAMNYSSMSGSSGDILEILSSVAGGWADDGTKDLMGVRNSQQATSIGKLIPAAGSIDQAFKSISGKSNVHTTLKQLPYSNLFYLAPLINQTK